MTSMSAASYQLATDKPVLSIGGFNGTDPYPTLALFKQWVRNGEIHYFIAGGGFGGFGGGGTASSSTSAISSWVTATFTQVKVGDVQMYDLTRPLK